MNIDVDENNQIEKSEVFIEGTNETFVERYDLTNNNRVISMILLTLDEGCDDVGGKRKVMIRVNYRPDKNNYFATFTYIFDGGEKIYVATNIIQ